MSKYTYRLDTENGYVEISRPFAKLDALTLSINYQSVQLTPAEARALRDQLSNFIADGEKSAPNQEFKFSPLAIKARGEEDRLRRFLETTWTTKASQTHG